MNAHDFSFRKITGEALPLSSFKGKAVLIVNTASKCGLTKQYAGLEDLYKEYRDRGLVVLGVPSNDFGGQEPGSEAEIATFCETKFAVTFPLTAKEPVTKSAAHPFYQWAAETLGADKAPRWNFHKYLIAPDGHLSAAFDSMTEPSSEALMGAIETLLPEASR